MWLEQRSCQREPHNNNSPLRPLNLTHASGKDCISHEEEQQDEALLDLRNLNAGKEKKG